MVTAYPQAIQREIIDWKDVPTSPYVKNYTIERKLTLLRLVEGMEGVTLLKFHQSLCPDCVEEEKWNGIKIDCLTYAKNSKVWMIKECQEHGVFKELYWGDLEMFKKAEKFQDPGIKILNPHIDKSQFDIDCPHDCGLCVEHESHTGLGNIVLTNVCDLTCWYCFFYAKEGEPIYEPTMDKIKFMLKRMRNTKPVGANAVQLTGGEPTLREDLPDIIRAAKEIGYDHVQLNTNGINLSKSPELVQKIHDAGCRVLYMSFDGMSPQTNPKNYWEAQKALENCKKANIGVVLVPTVIGGVNDHELGDIIRFGMGNLDVVRSVNFQPVSLVGRMPNKLRKMQRITIPGAIKRIEEQTDGQIGKEDFFPVPCAKQVTDFIEALKQEPKYRLSIHFACGMATYVFRDEDRNRLVPITRVFDIEGFFEYLGEMTSLLHNTKHRGITKARVVASLLWNIRKYIDNKEKPKSLKFFRMLSSAMTGGNYHGLADFHHNSLFIGMMHFQDPYNWDIDRIHKCDIHYAQPDGKVVPFCTFNVIPELYRDKVQRKFSIPPAEWEKKTGKKLNDYIYRRVLTPEERKRIIENYNRFRRTFEKPKLEPDWGDEEIDDRQVLMVAGKKPTMGHPAASIGSCSAGPEPEVAEPIIAGAMRFGAAKIPLVSQSNETHGSCGDSCGCH